MNIYKVWQNIKTGYDTYDSMVVVAKNEEEAKRIHPCHIEETKRRRESPKVIIDLSEHWDIYSKYCWPTIDEIDYIKVEKIATADPHIKGPIILVASFNAG